jgi:hypothetical protein
MSINCEKVNDLLRVAGPSECGSATADPPVPALNGVSAYPDFVSAPSLLENVRPDPPELVHGLLHQGSKMSLAGGSKSYKTWCMLDLACSVASGNTFWGRPVEQGAVIYVNLEIQESFMRHRMEDILKAKCIEAPELLQFWNVRGFDCNYAKLVPDLIRRMQNGNYVLAILDPIYKILGGADDNSAGVLTLVLNEMDRICVETEAAVVFGAHFSKGNQAGKDVLDRVSGSGVYARDPDSILTITPHIEENAFVVEPILRNFPPVSPFTLQWCHPLMRPSDSDPTKLKQKFNRHLKKKPLLMEFVDIFPVEAEPGLTNQDLNEEFAEKGWDLKTITDLRREAEGKGFIVVHHGACNRMTMNRKAT